MIEQEINKRLLTLADDANAQFVRRLTPNCGEILGARIPKLRALAKEYSKAIPLSYFEDFSFHYIEEFLLKGFLLNLKNIPFEDKIPFYDILIPKVDNWMSNDTISMSIKPKKADLEVAYHYFSKKLSSTEPFTLRFAIVYIFAHHMTENKIDEILLSYDKISSDHYYLNMAIAWGLSIAVVKFPEKAVDFLKRTRLPDFVINKAIQKSRDSFRVPKEMKDFLLTLRR